MILINGILVEFLFCLPIHCSLVLMIVKKKIYSPYNESCGPEITHFQSANSLFPQSFCSFTWVLISNWSFYRITLYTSSINSVFSSRIRNYFNFGFKYFFKTNNILNCLKQNKMGNVCVPQKTNKSIYRNLSTNQSSIQLRTSDGEHMFQIEEPS